MDGDTETIAFKTGLGQGVVLPDGKQPLPLGSGSIAALLGVGGMSNVYKIWNPQMERHRAVKLMKPDLTQESRQRFQTEIKITAALSHPNIIEIHSVGEWNTLSYIEMEFIDGPTLAEIIANKGALPLQVCTALGIMMARALTYAHDREYVLYGKTYHGLIHRDLKTSNIMVAADGRVKLMDFGIARPVETSLMTLDGAVMGTMQYLAPEQIDGKNVGVAADIYALGAILHESITGRKAFPQKNLSQLMSAKTANIFVPLRFFKIKIPRRLKNLVGKCMLLDPAKRPASAAALLTELETLHHTLSPETPENAIVRFMQSISEKKRTIYAIRRRLPAITLVAATIVGLALGSGVGFTYLRKHQPQQAPVAQAPLPTVQQIVSPPQPVPKMAEKSTVPPTIARKATRLKRAALQPIEPVKTTMPETSPPAVKSYLDSLKESSGIADPLEILVRESNANKHASALRVFDELPPATAAAATARILKLRALFALNRTSAISRFFEEPSINDGEYYLLKARYLLKQDAIDQAMALLEKSATADARQLEAEVMRRDYLYYRALCLGRLYEQSPTIENKKMALDGWFEVKNALRQLPDHSYFRKAVAEMQKIGTGALPAKG